MTTLLASALKRLVDAEAKLEEVVPVAKKMRDDRIDVARRDCARAIACAELDYCAVTEPLWKEADEAEKAWQKLHDGRES